MTESDLQKYMLAKASHIEFFCDESFMLGVDLAIKILEEYVSNDDVLRALLLEIKARGESLMKDVYK